MDNATQCSHEGSHATCRANSQCAQSTRIRPGVKDPARTLVHKVRVGATARRELHGHASTQRREHTTLQNRRIIAKDRVGEQPEENFTDTQTHNVANTLQRCQHTTLQIRRATQATQRIARDKELTDICAKSRCNGRALQDDERTTPN